VTAALTPELAIDYVRELSADVRAVAVLTADGRMLAGPPALAAQAAAFLAATAPAADVAVRTRDGVVFAARDPAHALVVAAGPLSLVGPTAIDARRALAALEGAGAPALVDTVGGVVAADPTDEALDAAEAVISATHGAF
jgi:hypothetical protein